MNYRKDPPIYKRGQAIQQRNQQANGTNGANGVHGQAPVAPSNGWHPTNGHAPATSMNGTNGANGHAPAQLNGNGHSSSHSTDSRSQAQMMHYMQWLASNAQPLHSPAKIQAYRNVALSTRRVGKREVRTFAPFQERLSAFQVITRNQILFLLLLVVGWEIGLFFLHTTMLAITLGVITFIYVIGFFISSLLATLALRGGSGEEIDDNMIVQLDQQGVEWPSYTILCPLFKEVAVVPQFVAGIKALNYPADKLQVLFLTEEIDQETRAALLAMDLPPGFTVLTVPQGSPQTKPRACNFGLLQATGQFIVIFDAEDKPEPNQLKKAVLTFANYGADLACVQAKLNFYNTDQNWLTRLFTAEYSLWFDIMLPGLQRSGLSLPLGGTSNHFRTDALRAVGGWDPFNVTEDCDAGLRLSQYQLTTAVLNSTTYEEATSKLKGWLFQRSRWNKGYMQTYLVHMRHPIQTLKSGRLRKFLSLQLIVGAWTAVLLVNPFMWLLSLLYIFFQPIGFYHQLFPTPVFYMGMLCFVFGNFFYVYLHMLGCLRRKQYALIKWVLLLPIYWVMMSASAYIAFYQLIVKPHHWEKTQHGNHLKQPGAEVQGRQWISGPALFNGASPISSANPNLTAKRDVFVSMPTTHMPAVMGRGLFKRPEPAASFTTATKEVPIVRRAITTSQQAMPKPVNQKPRFHIGLPHDNWLIFTCVLAVVISIVSTAYSFQHHWNLAYGDAMSHLEIGRRVLDNITPGLAQLGGVWLPLPHLLIALFAWNDVLWSTGLAGSIVGGICYLVTGIYVFLAARRLTHSSSASFIGALVFILNPNVLYLQSTPLTEPVCWATFTIACYYMLLWVQEDKTIYLIALTFFTFLATLARYDGWVLVIGFPLIIFAVGLWKRHGWRKIEGNLMMFCSLGALGIILWLMWGLVIFGNPLYFQNGPQSAQAQTSVGINPLQANQTHNLPVDFQLYTLNTIETMGLALFLLAMIGLIVYLVKRWKSPEMLAALSFLAPFAFYVAAIYTGQSGLFDSKTVFYPLGIIPFSQSPHLFNSRFGSEMVAPAAIFIATLTPKLPDRASTLRRWGALLAKALLMIVIIAQSAWIFHGGVITVIAQTDPPFCVASYPINVYLSEHYDGGRILQTDFPYLLSEVQEDIHFSNVIYEGTTSLWKPAVQHPENYVDWVIFSPGDTFAHTLTHNPDFTQNFTLVATGPFGMRLYHKNDLPPLPTFPIAPLLRSEQQFCTYSNYLLYK
jgi:cellulose synthase/poly-beta-1,6-N-acetylglucosamine synthase-like glycosyltransferase